MNIYILLAFVGLIMIAIGFCLNHEEPRLYCEELDYTATLKDWKNYAKTLIDSKPVRRELDLMDAYIFMQEMKTLNQWTMYPVYK